MYVSFLFYFPVCYLEKCIDLDLIVKEAEFVGIRLKLIEVQSHFGTSTNNYSGKREDEVTIELSVL